jgi:hypothetical protein
VRDRDRLETMTEGARASESALLIPVPKAEAAVQRWRRQLDPDIGSTPCRRETPAESLRVPRLLKLLRAVRTGPPRPLTQQE